MSELESKAKTPFKQLEEQLPNIKNLKTFYDLCNFCNNHQHTPQQCEKCMEIPSPLEVAQKELRKVSSANQILLKECDSYSKELEQAIGMLEKYTYLADVRGEAITEANRILDEFPRPNDSNYGLSMRTLKRLREVLTQK